MTSTPLDRAAIEARIPHREPFLFLDRILEFGPAGAPRAETSALVSEWTVPPQADFFRGHYPRFPVTPGVILCEHAFQSMAILLQERGVSFDLGDGVPVLARVEKAKFRRMVRPGETVRTKVEMAEVIGPAFYLAAKTSVGAELALEIRAAMTHAQGALK